MARPMKSRYIRALFLILVVVGGMWGWIGYKGYEPHLGLDLQGGISVVLAPKAGEATDAASLDKAIDIIRQRVDALGVAEPDISRQGSNVLIQLPGIDDQERALRLIGTTAKLRFRPVLEVPATPVGDEKLPACDDEGTFPDDDPKAEVIFCSKEGGDQRVPIRLGPVGLEGSDVATASALLLDPTQGGGGYQVSLRLTSAGAKKFATLTGQLACNPSGDVKRQLAIVLDRVVESHPQMGEEVQCNEGISGGEAQITGNFDKAAANDLALILRYGALPIELVKQTVTEVSPTLGKDSLRSGLLAGFIGIGIVFLYVLLFYRAMGVLIWIGLAVHAAFTFAIIILLGQTAGFALSLAGIAGLIVSLGIATDSFIVYFERIKDEVATGRSVKASVDRAWLSARRTIVAADLVTALAAIVLYFLAVGSVRGFALMLGLSTTLDLAVSYLFMHPSVWLLAQTRVLQKSKALGARRAMAAAKVAAGEA
jgi:preprotein translocase subunit SecD